MGAYIRNSFLAQFYGIALERVIVCTYVVASVTVRSATCHCRPTQWHVAIVVFCFSSSRFLLKWSMRSVELLFVAVYLAAVIMTLALIAACYDNYHFSLSRNNSQWYIGSPTDGRQVHGDG